MQLKIMSVKLSHITKIYGHQKALEDISFEIKTGEIVGLLGPNGAGKSTIMKILTCYIPPSMGEASINGFDVQEQALEVQRLVGYLPESNPLYYDMYIREYLSFVAGIHKIENRSKRIKEMIQITGLGIESHKKIGALSKGFKQRVGLAQALLHNPQVLILDEPTSGLDPNQLVDIRNLIKELGRQKTVILSTHIMQEVEAVCDRAIILNKGVIVADDKTQNLTNQGASRNTLIVEFDKVVNRNQLLKLANVLQARNANGNIWLIESKDRTDIRPELMRWSIHNNVAIQSLQLETKNLEDAFRQLTKN
jgi:ABC-2 type transport system ATP-binding protein